MIFELAVLFAAGLFGGVLNSVAGGGSFITFPALLLAGVPPISANATNTFASCAGYLSGAYAFREDLRSYRKRLPEILVTSLVGGLLGAWLLLLTPETLFRDAIPWLLLFAILLFAVGGTLNALLARVGARHRHASSVARVLLFLMLLGVCIYGGFFNAGLGIVVLSYLALAGYSDINAMNGLKLLASSAISLTAIGLFAWNGAIAWHEGAVVLCGTLAGGYVAAHFSRGLPQRQVRRLIILAGACITVYFFIDTYG